MRGDSDRVVLWNVSLQPRQQSSQILSNKRAYASELLQKTKEHYRRHFGNWARNGHSWKQCLRTLLISHLALLHVPLITLPVVGSYSKSWFVNEEQREKHEVDWNRGMELDFSEREAESRRNEDGWGVHHISQSLFEKADKALEVPMMEVAKGRGKRMAEDLKEPVIEQEPETLEDIEMTDVEQPTWLRNWGRIKDEPRSKRAKSEVTVAYWWNCCYCGERGIPWSSGLGTACTSCSHRVCSNCLFYSI